MRKRSLSKKQLRIIAFVFLAALLAVGFYLLNCTVRYENAIHVRFEADLTAEQERSILSQFETAVLLDADDAVLHDYTLVFPRLSERRVQELISPLCRTDGVLDASYVRVVSLPAESSN